MIPFLKKHQDAASSNPVESVERKPDEEKPYDVFEACAEDLINAIHAKDTKAVAEALRAAFDLNEPQGDE